MTYEFDEAIEADTDGTVVFPERWTMGPGFAHGGYLMSVALAAGMRHSTHRDPVTMSAHFLRPGKVGEARVESSVLKAGRTLSTVRTDIVQGDSTRVATLTTFGDLSGAGSIAFRSIADPNLPPPGECVTADPSGPLVPRMIDNLVLLLTKDSTRWATGEQLETATMEGWVAFGDGRPIDTVSLPMFADALPPPIFSVGAFAPWTPTVELTVHIRRRPATQRLGVSFRTDLIGGTFFESTGTLWNDDGTLVAMSRQLQLVNL